MTAKLWAEESLSKVGSERGPRLAALFYSLIESAKLRGVEPRAYLRKATLRAVRSSECVVVSHAGFLEELRELPFEIALIHDRIPRADKAARYRLAQQRQRADADQRCSFPPVINPRGFRKRAV